jgi:hypothetical protein
MSFSILLSTMWFGVLVAILKGLVERGVGIENKSIHLEEGGDQVM